MLTPKRKEELIVELRLARLVSIVIHFFFKFYNPSFQWSAFIWIQRYKMKGKAEFNQIIFFRRKLYLSSQNLKKELISKVYVQIRKYFFSLVIKDGLKSIWWFYCPGPGSGSAFIKFCGSGFAYDQCVATSLFFFLSDDLIAPFLGDIRCVKEVLSIFIKQLTLPTSLFFLLRIMHTGRRPLHCISFQIILSASSFNSFYIYAL